uniref:Alcohol acetyltransferase n=1 Tax=uncultured bacterium Contig1756 TaxID=1393499 RepID=W0FH32_9BACT|nr:alcohol acetyltransferase [uncultured bacterium Contig1756]
MKKQWYRLDNAALIFPAIIRKNWNNVFRVSATLQDPVDPKLLARAAEELMPRFPTFFVRLRVGFFWYYLETVTRAPEVREDYAYPLTHMTRRELRTCCVRILYYENRIAVELFHSVTDGTGGLVLLQNLTARYLALRYGTEIPPEGNILDYREKPKAEETRDCFLSCGAARPLSRAEDTAYRLRGTPEEDLFRHITTGIVPTEALKEKAREQGVTVTAFLAAVLAQAAGRRQEAEGKTGRRARPVKITVPVNLRRTFGMNTLRNFTLAVNIGYDPRLGTYTHEQICALMGHQLAAETIPQRMAGRVAKNVNLQKNLLLRLTPLPLKTLCMRTVYALSGENKGCLNLSNMGVVRVPAAMEPLVERFEFIIGVQYTYPNNCSVVTYGGKTYISMIRGIRESELERLVFSRLVELGIPVEIESNRR